MTFEATLERIAVALETIAANRVLSANPTAIPKSVAEKLVAKKPTEVEIPVLVPPKVETPVIVASAPVAIPSVTLTPAAPVATCPITSGKELMNYVMEVYRTLGPAKGAAIQGVLNSIGCQAINEVRPDQYATLYAGLEQLKAG